LSWSTENAALTHQVVKRERAPYSVAPLKMRSSIFEPFQLNMLQAADQTLMHAYSVPRWRDYANADFSKEITTDE
jgi:hypothetical protein